MENKYKPRLIIAREDNRMRIHVASDKKMDDFMTNHYNKLRQGNIVYAGSLPEGKFDEIMKLTSYDGRPHNEVHNEVSSLIKKLKQDRK